MSTPPIHRAVASRPGLATRSLSVAGLLGLAAVSVWGQVARGTGLAAWDAPLAGWVGAHRVPALDAAVQLLSDTASRPVVVTAGVVVTATLLLARRWPAAAAAAAAAVLAGGLTTGLKALTTRPRPPADQVLGTPLGSWAFPSGHTLQGTVAAGLVAAVLLALLAHRRRARAAVVVLAGAEAVGVGLSRIYLGHHWLTDVVAGWLVAGVLLSLAVPVVVAGPRLSVHRGGRA